jgi:phosphatidylglycerophosphatase A
MASPLAASVAENHSTHLIAQAFDFLRIGGAPETFGEIEELPLFAAFSLYAILDEFQKHPISAEPARLRQAANPRCEVHR